jgi:hypothetical protein
MARGIPAIAGRQGSAREVRREAHEVTVLVRPKALVWYLGPSGAYSRPQYHQQLGREERIASDGQSAIEAER